MRSQKRTLRKENYTAQTGNVASSPNTTHTDEVVIAVLILARNNANTVEDTANSDMCKRTGNVAATA